LKSLYVRMAGEFSKGLATAIDQYCELTRSGDRDALRLHLHSLKGTSATLGAMALSTVAAKLEKLCRGPVEDFAPLEHVEALHAVLVPTQKAVDAAILEMTQSPDAQEVQPHVNAGRLDPDQKANALRALDELIDLLNANDLTVLERFPQLRDSLAVFAPSQLQDMEGALMGLNLEEAGRLCAGLKASI
jgi:HPt (histidine-containing phosphotransfer) domain-containing protein